MCRSAIGDCGRREVDEEAYILGFGTDHGTVAAAAGWDEPMERMRVRPALAERYERAFHDAGVSAGSIALKRSSRPAVRDELTPPLLERAIGVVYRPSSEMQSHYFYESLARQFDEYIWFDATAAVKPLPEEASWAR